MIPRRALPVALLAVAFPLVAIGCAPVERAAGEQEPPSSDNSEVVGRGEGKDAWWDHLPREAWSAFDPVEVSDAWFEVYRLAAGVHAIYEPGQFEEVVSYLVTGDERALLFDTGLGIGDIASVVAELTPLPVVVLNSHTHYDHVGGNHAFDEVYGTDLDYTVRHAAGRSPEEVAEFVGDGWIWKETPAGFDRGSYRGRPFEVTHVVRHGERIDLGGVVLEVLLTPGHAPDALCLLDRSRRRLFTGDTFYPATLYAHLPGTDFTAYADSAHLLASLSGEIDHVHPGHNEPVMEPSQLVALAEAFDAVQLDGSDYVSTDGLREYDFGRFSLLVSDPPPWE